MMNIKGIFAVSLIAMVAMVAGAHTSNAVAAIASKGYVDQQVGSKANATDLNRKVDIYQGDAKANQAVITNGTGNITTGFITKSMLGADVEIPAAITVDSALSSTSTNPVQNKVINTALNAKEVTSNKVTSTNYDANVSSDTKYPTVKAVADAIADVEEKIPAKITVDSALSSTSTNPVQNKVINTALSGKVTIAQGSGAANKAVITNSSGNVTTGTISSGMIADDAVTTAKLAAGAVANDNLANSAVTSAKIADGTIVNADIAANAAIATSKISGLGTLATKSAVTGAEITDGTITNADIAANAAIAASKVSGLAKVATTGLYGDLTGTPTIPTVNNATLTIKKNGAPVGTFTANASADKEIDIEVPAATTASDILTTATVTSSGTGAVLTGVSVTAGKVTLQKGNVQIPSGGQNATSYVSIWVE